MDPAPMLDAYEFALRALGEGLGWSVATAWEPGEDGLLRCVASWCDEPETVTDFVAATVAAAMRPGDGLPGKVFKTGEAVWLVDAAADETLPRQAAARASGLHTVFAFPVRSERGILGVVELVTRDIRHANPRRTSQFVSLGVQLGHLVERRRAERAAAAHEAQTNAILDAALDAIVTMDAEGRVVAFNPPAERIFDYPAAQAVGRDMAELIVPPDLRARHRAGLSRYLAGGEATVLGRRIEIEGIDAHGRRFPVELTIARVAGDGPPLFCGYLRDITDRHIAEREMLASRVRIVEAGDAARRRIERDLHDGAQQRLVGLALMLRLARNQVETGDGAKAVALLDEASAELADATAELRELARGIHPAVLSDGGLEPALRALAVRASLPVKLTGVPRKRLPEAVEATAYFVVAEALTNVERYSGAQQAEVDVRHAGGMLTVEVTDDGRGGADPDRGSGLNGLGDRIAALGGTLDIVSPSGAGTRLRAEMPCAS